MKAEAAEEARRWEEEQEAEVRRKEAMKLSQEERDNILQVSPNPGHSVTQVKIEIFARVYVLTGPS